MPSIYASVFLATALALSGAQASSECYQSVHNSTMGFFSGAAFGFSYEVQTAADSPLSVAEIPGFTLGAQYFYRNKHLPTGAVEWGLAEGPFGCIYRYEHVLRHWSYRKFRIETIGCTGGETNHAYLLHHVDEYIEDKN
ncbi:hypothetical protein N7541_008126 [Penicillium brevicompactum]|uniref:Uncharacterized protein n=1 Tax=Penicillium brevicompactum TaxID=5074 RepID=A0A9W9R0R1_PENBR|nr:hypothetical protein N7541_008126 [Penicillium brevicompactum]